MIAGFAVWFFSAIALGVVIGRAIIGHNSAEPPR